MKLKTTYAAVVASARSLWQVLRITYRLSPTIVWFKSVDLVFDSTFPVATAFFAGLTTTALADAFTGVAGAREDAVLYVAVTAGIALVDVGWGRISSYARSIAGLKLRGTVGKEMLEKYLTLDYWRYEDKETSDLKDRAERFSNYFEGSFESVFTAASATISCIVALVAVGYSSPLIAYVLVVALIPTVWVQIQTTRLDIGWWDANRERNRKRYGFEDKITREDSVRDTRIFGLSNFFLTERQKMIDGNLAAEKGYLGISTRWWFIGYFTENAALLFSLIYTVFQIASGMFPIGHFVFTQSMVLRATSSMSGLAGRFGNIGENMEHFKNYDQFNALPPAPDGTHSLTGPVGTISLKGVSFRYPQAQTDAVQGVTLEIKPGEHVAIVGENGAGKSTLIRILLGLARPTAGSAELNGMNLSEYKLSSWHDRVGILFQGFDYYYFASIRDNVWYGRIEKEPTEKAIRTALKRARAYDFVQKLPKKEDTISSTYYGNADDSTRLSGGQLQRISIARVFFREPEVLILDEPTSALDAKAESEIFEEIHKEMEGKTVIIISHRFSTVRKADRIVVLDNGKIKEEGTHKELMKLKGLYHDMFELQAKEYR